MSQPCRICQNGVSPTIIEQSRQGLIRCIECTRDVTLAVNRLSLAAERINEALHASWHKQRRMARVATR